MPHPLGLILGTGWNGIVSNLRNTSTSSFWDIFKRSAGVPGHEGTVIKGTLKGRDCIILSGRFHTYEGYTSAEAVDTIKYLHEEGVKKVVVTSACGGLNPKYQVGDVVILSDVLTLFAQSPLVGAKFQDMSRPFSPKLIEAAETAAFQTKTRTQKGTYAYFRGPHFETFADKMALRFLGADVCGMSTVPEVIMANYLKMEVAGLSLVTNLAFVKHSHEEVLASAKANEKKLNAFIEEFIKLS